MKRLDKVDRMRYRPDQPMSKMIPAVRKGRVVQVRRQTNEELMHAALTKWGKIRLRVSLAIYDADTLRFYGWQGAAASVDVRSIKEARAFYAGLHEAIRQVSERVGGKFHTKASVRMAAQ